MISALHLPAEPLCQIFSSFYYYKGFMPDHEVDRFLPDGNTEVIIDLTDSPKFIFDNDTLQQKQGFTKFWASGVRNEFISIHSGRDSEMLILNLVKGRAFPFFQMPMSEMADRVVEGDLVFGNLIQQIREAVGAAKTPEEKFKITEAFLIQRVKNHLTVNPFVDFAIQKMVENPSQLTIKSVVSKVGFSQKHLIHLFKKHIGVSPKSYLKILRFQKAIQEIDMKPNVEWSQIAYDCGYFDQAHFINDFKKFSGFTPEEYFIRKSPFLNYVPVR